MERAGEKEEERWGGLQERRGGGEGKERGLNESRSECMQWRSLWGEIFPLRGTVLGSLISELCCDARQEYSRATTAATRETAPR